MHPGSYSVVLSSGTSQLSICKIKTKIDRNLSTDFSLDGKNIILYYSITLTNLACTGCFQVIKNFFFDDKWQVGYETQGPSPSSRAESQARIFEFPIFSKLRSGLCFYISLRIK